MDRRTLYKYILFNLLSGRKNEAEVFILDKDEEKNIYAVIEEFDEKNNLSIELLKKDIEKISFKEKHKRDIKQYVPKNIINQKFNSKKKGGR